MRQAIAAVGLILVRHSDSPGQSLRPRGSAVIVRSDGMVVTNYHVIADANRYRIFDEIHLALSSEGQAAASSKRRFRLRPILVSRDLDLALLRIEPDAEGNVDPDNIVFPAIEIGDSDSVNLLDDLIIIGFPEKGGSSVTVNIGMVEGKDVLGNWIKTDARLIRGNSGGAAVNSEGKLIGIPTKVITDSQSIDRDGDGFPDSKKVFGAVGFLRPSKLVAIMLSRLDSRASASDAKADDVSSLSAPLTLTVRGMVRSSADGKPLAGVMVGLLPAGVTEVNESNLLTWGGTNPEGVFVLNKPVPPGRYTIKAKAMGYQGYTREVEINQASGQISIKLAPAVKN